MCWKFWKLNIFGIKLLNYVLLISIDEDLSLKGSSLIIIKKNNNNKKHLKIVISMNFVEEETMIGLHPIKGHTTFLCIKFILG